MPENKFENKVQQEMLGFKIKPSEAVWLNVEERIRKKKRRRFFFIIFFFAGLSLLGYWQRDFLFADSDVLSVESTTIHNDKILDSEAIKTTAAAEYNKQAVTNSAKESVQPSATVTEKPIISPKKKIGSSVNKKEKTTAQVLLTTKKMPSVTNKATSKEIAVSQNTTDKTLKEVTTEEKSIVVKNSADSISDFRTEKLVEEDIANKIQINSIQKTEKEADLIAVAKILSDSTLKNELPADTLTVQKNASAKSAKWKWGLHITPGNAYLNEYIFSISSNKNFRGIGANTSSVGSPSLIPPADPSIRESGFSLQLGGFAQRKISSRMELSLGLQYSYYSDHILVGARRDSVLNFSPQLMAISDASIVYGAANSYTNYTSSYHFIELPVTMHIRLNKNLNKPFNLNLGVVAGQMFASNALVYDRSFGGIYFKNKSQFNKTQFSFTSGFEWTIPIRKMQWSLGPVVDVHVNRFMLNPNETDKYLLMFGFRTRIIFPSKK